jgi:hypothetical protein
MVATLQSHGQFEGRFLDVLQKFVSANLTGRLSVHFAETRALIFIRTGWVIHAETELAQGKDVLSQCLSVEFGDYEFESGLESQTRTITDSFSRIAISYTRLSAQPSRASGEITISSGESNSKNENQPIAASTLAALNKVLIEALGPAGALILEDAASELGWDLTVIPQTELGQLIRVLRLQISDVNSSTRLEAALKKVGLNEVKL